MPPAMIAKRDMVLQVDVGDWSIDHAVRPQNSQKALAGPTVIDLGQEPTWFLFRLRQIGVARLGGEYRLAAIAPLSEIITLKA